jgi:uncharacterized protein (TIGR02646 family)
MIRIDRSSTACPEPLQAEGERDLIRLRALSATGFKSHDFRKSIFGSPEVKARLWEMQHCKCCYCEREYERRHSDVEHFRPKTEAVRADGRKDLGYWWLAYRFDNLYFGCLICNRLKGSHFPLRAGARALIAEGDPHEVAEQSLLIDPGFEDPEEHLTFVWIPGRGYEIAPRNGSERGKKTIEVLKLDRDDLAEFRRAHYQKVLQPVLEQFAIAQNEATSKAVAQVRKVARALAAADTPFALLARVALRALLEPPEP